MSWKQILIKIGAYYLIISLLFVGFVSYSKNKQKQTTAQMIEDAIKGQSKYRDVTDNPCKYSIHGDPMAPEGYLKVSFYCPDGTSSLNTLDLRAIEGKKLEDTLKELARINGFSIKIVDGKLKQAGSLVSETKSPWLCYQNKTLVNLSQPIIKSANLECFKE